jgi:hypothetical protein
LEAARARRDVLRRYPGGAGLVGQDLPWELQATWWAKALQFTDELAFGIRGLWPEARSTIDRATPPRLNQVRRGYVTTGGHSVVDPEVEIHEPAALIRYLPRVVTLVFGAPFVWEWFDVRGDAGVFRLFASIEMLLLYGLIPGFAASLLAQVRRRQTAAWLLFAYVLLAATAMGLTIANIGTLFRLRLQFLMPLAVLALSCDAFTAPYRWLSARCSVWARRPAGPTDAVRLNQAPPVQAHSEAA